MYVYGELPKNHIRLLVVRYRCSDEYEQPLDFAIREYETCKLPRYIAVSYEWGNAPPIKNISIDGRALMVRENLWQCLYAVRNTTQERYFWVDSLCIDQQNLAERDTQVQLMDQIYTNAAYVVAWLGLYSEKPNQQIEAAYGVAELERHVRGGLGIVCALPYWSRMWIIQELLLARDVWILCGSCYVSWTEFKDAVSVMNPSIRTLWPHLTAVPSLVESRNSSGPYNRAFGLHQLLKKYYSSRCRDPRDRIFAVLSLLPPEQRRILARFFPNYSLSLKDVVVITLAHFRGHASEGSEGTLLDVFQIWDQIERARLLAASAKIDPGYEAARLDVQRRPTMSALLPTSLLRRSFYRAFNGPGASRGIDGGILAETAPRLQIEQNAVARNPSQQACESQSHVSEKQLEDAESLEFEMIKLEESYPKDPIEPDSEPSEWTDLDNDALSRSFIELKYQIWTATGPHDRTENVLMHLHRHVPLRRLAFLFHRAQRAMSLSMRRSTGAMYLYFLLLRRWYPEFVFDVRAYFLMITSFASISAKTSAATVRDATIRRLVHFLWAWRMRKRYGL